MNFSRFLPTPPAQFKISAGPNGLLEDVAAHLAHAFGGVAASGLVRRDRVPPVAFYAVATLRVVGVAPGVGAGVGAARGPLPLQRRGESRAGPDAVLAGVQRRHIDHRVRGLSK